MQFYILSNQKTVLYFLEKHLKNILLRAFCGRETIYLCIRVAFKKGGITYFH